MPPGPFQLPASAQYQNRAACSPSPTPPAPTASLSQHPPARSPRHRDVHALSVFDKDGGEVLVGTEDMATLSSDGRGIEEEAYAEFLDE